MILGVGLIAGVGVVRFEVEIGQRVLEEEWWLLIGEGVIGGWIEGVIEA